MKIHFLSAFYLHVDYITLSYREIDIENGRTTELGTENQCFHRQPKPTANTDTRSTKHYIQLTIATKIQLIPTNFRHLTQANPFATP